ncbi:MAG: hypothetical protein Ct9H90mP9_2050 [Pseudomonadota bacterium]|nr:MAG: hypothetical protein Ct9H90mP9_2050 [Pseudomonadota bacterium]
MRKLLQGMDWNGIGKASRKYLQGPLQEKHPFLILGKDSPGFRDIARFEPVLNLNQEKGKGLQSPFEAKANGSFLARRGL